MSILSWQHVSEKTRVDLYCHHWCCDFRSHCFSSVATPRETRKCLDPPPKNYRVASRARLLQFCRTKSIAVLPFDNLSRDPDNAFFAEGVQDEILTRLAKVADLKVISRTSTQRFKSAPIGFTSNRKAAWRDAHSRRQRAESANDQVRVNVQLINAMNDAHLWAETYDRKLIDIFSVESEIAKTIADTLQAKLTGSEKQMMAAQPTNNTEAYELYLQRKIAMGKAFR